MKKEDLELKLKELLGQEQLLRANLNAVLGAIKITEEYLKNWDIKGKEVKSESSK